MKIVTKSLRVAGRIFVTIFLVMLFFFIVIRPARAPHGGKNSLGGRTIASLQEEDFDRRLLRYQLCYGVQFVADEATLERRRECKAMIVHRLDLTFSQPGSYLKLPLEFHCASTAFGKNDWSNELSVGVTLKPNAESQSMDKAIAKAVDYKTISIWDEKNAQDACSFLTECKSSMRPQHFSLRKLGKCLTTRNSVHRKILFDEIGAMIFRDKEKPLNLYAELLNESKY